MPISPENRKRYPSYWRQLSHIVRFVLQRGKCAWCDARHGLPHPVTGSKVVLTTAHIHDMRPEADRLDNLRGLCQRCHNRHDAAHRHSDLVGEIRAMRRAATSVSIAARIPNGVDSIRTLFFAAKVDGAFHGADVTTILGFNACVSIKALLGIGLLEDAERGHIDRRRRPLRLSDKGRHVVAQLEAAMMRAADGERVAA